MNIVHLLYTLLLPIAFILYLPIYVYRGKINMTALKERLGFISKSDKESIWIQVVSVGEVNLIAGLLKELAKQKKFNIVISTTTLTGNKVARESYSSFAKIIYFPLDIPLVITKVIKKIKPKIFIAVETELWPNLFYYLEKKDIPIVIINGRISDKAFKRYKRIAKYMKSVLSKCTYIGVQNNTYKERFAQLGCDKKKITISGNMKFEGVSINEERIASIISKYSSLIQRKEPFMVAGSTHDPEEKIILDIYNNLRAQGINLTLLLAPRHVERAGQIAKTVKLKGLTPVLTSQLQTTEIADDEVYILDTIGELVAFYQMSTFCFVGGSLMPHGGQNILEPIYLSKPTIFGPYMSNFPDVEEIVLKQNAGLKINSPDELETTIINLITDSELNKKLKSNSVKVFNEEKEELKQNMEIILKCLN